MSPEIGTAFNQFEKKTQIKSTKLHYNGKSLVFKYKHESYTCRRIYFDDFLIQYVKKSTKTEFYLNKQVEKITIKDSTALISIKNSNTVYNTKIVIGADGANSVVAKYLAGKQMDRKHYFGSVRAFYKNIEGVNSDTVEIFFHKKHKVNYVWLFPLYNNYANVGFGMLSSKISKQKINIKNTFYDIINSSPVLSSRFQTAIQEGSLDGFGVPLASKVGKIHGNNFMLIGDAASLSNPISGTGIMNAVLSGKLAGEQVIKCFNENKFDDNFMSQYYQNLDKAILKQIKKSFFAQQILSRIPFILDIAFALLSIKWVHRKIEKRL